MVFKQTWNLLQQDKEVMWFPILSAIITILIGTLFGGILWAAGFADAEPDGSATASNALFYSIVFLYYIIAYFVVTYFRVGLTAIVFERINGKDIGFSEGIKRANSIAGKILIWSLITSTVGIVLKIISDRSKLLGKLVAALLGTAWNIVTMFIAPTLLLDNVSVWQSIKNSGTVFKKTWGETLVIAVSMWLVMLVIQLGIISLFAGLLFAAFSIGAGTIVYGALLGLFVITLIVTSVIYTSLTEYLRLRCIRTPNTASSQKATHLN